MPEALPLVNGAPVYSSAGSNLERIIVPEPIIGGKGWCSDRMGKFLFEEGPGVLRCIACTHTGSAHVTFWDSMHGDHRIARPLFRMHPTVLGHWMLDIGFNDGLMVQIDGKITPFLTFVWMKKK